MKIVFLDIDEVLTSIEQRVGLYAIYPDGIFNKLDIVKVGLIKHLCERVNAKIVITSSMRIYYTIDYIKSMFKGAGWVDCPIIDVTSKQVDLYRGELIERWLKLNPEVKEYVIIDDSSDMLPNQLHRFVHVDGTYGFSLKDLTIALRVFGERDIDLENIVNTEKVMLCLK